MRLYWTARSLSACQPENSDIILLVIVFQLSLAPFFEAKRRLLLLSVQVLILSNEFWWRLWLVFALLLDDWIGALEDDLLLFVV